MKAKTESVLYVFMMSHAKKKPCRKCGAIMLTMDEVEVYSDQICVRCGKELLAFMRKHGKEE